MKVYLLFYSELFGDGNENVYGIYSTYENAFNAIPPHEVDEFYDIFEATLNKTFLWDLPDEQ